MDYVYQNTEVLKGWLLVGGGAVCITLGLEALVHIAVNVARRWFK